MWSSALIIFSTYNSWMPLTNAPLTRPISLFLFIQVSKKTV